MEAAYYICLMSAGLVMKKLVSLFTSSGKESGNANMSKVSAKGGAVVDYTKKFLKRFPIGRHCTELLYLPD